MPDYIYLLENRLSADQQNALHQVRDAARETDTVLFLSGDAVRDLTSGHAVRDLEVSVHGNALKLKNAIEKRGGKVWGEDEEARALYLCFPGTVRLDLVSTHRVEYPKPGKPVYHAASIQEELRHRDFTVNAMAISLNEGSFGLLMDPMNGAADIESRTLRLVSNYGFLEDPSLLIRAIRYNARLGWEMDARTQTRYSNAKEEGVIEHLSLQAQKMELEKIAHEEEGLKVLQALEAEGWMKVLFPAWTVAKADREGLTALCDLAVELLLQGVHADISAAQMRLLTAGLGHKDLATLKTLILCPGFVEEWNSLDALAEGFAKALLAKANAKPSASFKLFTSYDPEAVLWLGFTSKNAAIKEHFNLFLKVWPEIRQRIPYALLQEMRITAELPAYQEIVQAVFLEMLDGKLSTPEETRAFLEPYSPPPPPPPVTIKRPRIKREAKLKETSFEDEEESEDSLEGDEDLDGIGGDDEDLDLDVDLSEDSDTIADEDDGDSDEEVNPKSTVGKHAPQKLSKFTPVKQAPKPVAAPVKAEKPAVASAASKPEEKGKSTPASKPKVESRPKSKVASASQQEPVSKATKSPLPKKVQTKAVEKPQVKAAQKPAPKIAAKSPAKTPAKAPSQTSVKKTAKVPASKPAPGKKPVPAHNPESAKRAKPSKPVSKLAKKR
jgi:tRNA nucleotidyltransferase/poly(A) polymerase